MRFRLLIGILVALAVVALPRPGAAQTPAPTPPPAGEPGAAAQQEAQGLVQRLGRLQQQALQDPKVKAANDSLSAYLDKRMTEIEPGYPALMEKAKSFQANAAAAQSAGDTAKLQQLAAEGANLQAGILAARQKALRDPGVQQHAAAFQHTLLAKMAELDPESPKLLQRLNELSGPGSR